MLEWLSNRFNDLIDFLYRCVLTMYDMWKDLVLFFVDGFLSITALALEGMGALFSGLDLTSYMSALPANVVGILSAIGLGQALSMIATAITIRLTLQLIPFTRLGS